MKRKVDYEGRDEDVKSKWSRLGWLLLVLPLWLTFGKVDVDSPLLSVLGYLLFGMAVWIWFRFEVGMDRRDEKGEKEVDE